MEEAILWHGGEALAAQQAYINMDKSQRTALLAFLGSL
ncbi:di-heme oxidoredictase family protein [Pseudoalteromonas sp. T1lg23B]|nr:di-heme oxidoredictase family protein [Pseudoalteromonas sp. T1lg23B]